MPGTQDQREHTTVPGPAAIRRGRASTLRRLLVLCAALLAPAAAAAPAGAALPAANATYITIDYPGADSTAAYGVNRSGPLGRTIEVVGSFHDIQGLHGFLYAGGRFTRLDVPVPYAVNTQALGINGLGQVVGTYYDGADGATCSFLYSGGTYTNLGFGRDCHYQTPPTAFAAHGINNAGYVAGVYEDTGSNNTLQAEGFLGTASSLLQTHYDVAGARSASIDGLNNNPSHQMVGHYVDASGLEHGAIFNGWNTNGVRFDVPGTSSGTELLGINDSGVMVGRYGTSLWNERGFVDDNGHISTLSYPGALGTVAAGLNDPGVNLAAGYNVVGSYWQTDLAGRPAQHAFLATVKPLLANG